MKVASFNVQKILLYVSISVFLLLLSLTGVAAFLTIMIVTGIAALIARRYFRWFSSGEKQSNIRKYAGTVAWLGLVNMVLLFLTVQTYDYVTERVGEKITVEIDNFKDRNDSFPDNIQSITGNLDLYFWERYFADKIEYKVTGNDYELELKTLFNKQRKFDKNQNEWR